jgi:cellulose biosynthesis protein BcsQ
MKSIAFFNNKGGVGKTSLIYHLGWMFAELGKRVVLADLDSRSNLTAMCFSDEAFERIYGAERPDTVYTAIEPLLRGVGDVRFFDPAPVTDGVAIVPGDLLLSDFEDELFAAWPRCLEKDERAFRVTAAFHRIIGDAIRRDDADLALIDVGPNFGALNRAAMIAADFVVIPVTPDLFSVRGLRNVGARLKSWRAEWRERLERAPELEFSLPGGSMQAIGYIVSRHNEWAGVVARSTQEWIAQFPAAYLAAVDDSPVAGQRTSLGSLRDYRSLTAMAQEARKPMFKLRPGDGAIGGHQAAVAAAYDDFERLAREIAARIALEI